MQPFLQAFLGLVEPDVGDPDLLKTEFASP